jgi:hypothetical protein
MLKIKLLSIFSILFLFTALTYAQNQSVEIMMNDKQMKDNIINYIINHQELRQEFMNKLMTNNKNWSSIMNYMMNNDQARKNIMDKMFSKADTDKAFFEEMRDYMENHRNMMTMMEQMENKGAHNGMMNSRGMSH